MKKETLIEVLQSLPDGVEVCLFDWRQNIYNANGDPDDPDNGIGIHSDFTVEHITENVTKPFIALSFENEDYDEDGNPNYLIGQPE